MIQQWILSAATESQVSITYLSNVEVERLLSAINKKFCNPMDTPHHLWESFVGDTSRRRSDGWRKASEFPEGAPILLFQDRTKFEAFAFSSMAALDSILAESP